MITVKSREEFLQEAKKQLPDNPICAEIGVYQGDFSKHILKTLLPKWLYLIDPFCIDNEKKYPDGLPTQYSTYTDFCKTTSCVRNEIQNGIVCVIKKKSLYVCDHFPKFFFNFIYIDASHLYGDCKQDHVSYLLRLGKQGLLCGHDYGNELFPGVKQAVDEFCTENNFEMIIFNENGGDYALRAIQ